MGRYLTIFVAYLALSPTISFSDNIEAELAQATSALSTTKYELAYKMKPGEQIRYAVEHLATIDTRISGNRQESKMTTNSTKVWQVKEATDSNITFEYKVADVAMTRKDDGVDEIRYDSKKDKEPPVQFRSITQSLGKPLATITIDQYGNVIKRDRGGGAPDLGFGGPVVPLPPKAVKLGQSLETMTEQVWVVLLVNQLEKLLELRTGRSLEQQWAIQWE